MEFWQSVYTQFMQCLGAVNSFVWGPVMLVLLVGTGVYLTFGLRLLTFRNLPHGFAHLWGGRKKGHADTGEVSSFNALMTALAACIGTGNIVGVSTAIFVGGPGALFWMWMTALVGMATKFCEAFLAVTYREKSPAGNFVGGPMYAIKNGLGKNWRWLAWLFAFFGAVACFGIGNMTQCNSIGDAVKVTLGIPPYVTAGVLFVITSLVVLGGVSRIGEVAGKLVPAMAAVYIIVSIVVIVTFADQIPTVFMYVLTEAFTPTAAQGGFAGATVMMAIRMGMARGVFSNEAGLGSAPIAHAAATTRSPIRQALIAMLDPFIDTIIVCSMTGFCILVTGQWCSGLKGAAISTAAYETALPGFGAILVTCCLAVFAFTTVLGWSVYGDRCIIYLLGDKAQKPFRILFCCIVPVGTVLKLDLVWDLADTFNALMAVPNLVSLLLLSPVIFKIMKIWNGGAGEEAAREEIRALRRKAGLPEDIA